MKTILITGSTDGIGKLAAIKLAKENHKILLHGRTRAKLEQSITDIKIASGNENVTGFIADLSSFDAIKQMVNKIKAQFTNIEVLINNAGVFKTNSENTSDDIDLRLLVNYLAPVLLTNELMTLLKNADSPRIINLSSAAQSPVSLNALQGLENLNQQSAYAQSKLALTIWSFYLAKEYTSLNVIAVNPGSLLNTKMVEEAYGQYWSSADKGAAILYELAVSNEFAKSSGKYFDNDKGKFSTAHPDAYNKEKIAALISLTHKILEL